MVNLGNAVQQLGSDAGQIQRFMLANKSRQEVTDAQTELLRLTSELSTELDAAYKKWKPGDAPLAETFQGVIKGRLDNIGYNQEGEQRFSTQAGNQAFRTGAERLSAEMIQHSLKADSDLQGKAAVIAHTEMVNGVGGFLNNHPAFYEVRKDEVLGILRDPHGKYSKIPAIEREKLALEATEKLAWSAAEGHVKKHPHVMLDVLNDPALAQDQQYGWIARDIPVNKLDDLKSKARTEILALEADAARIEAQENRARVRAARESEVGLIEKLGAHMDDPKNNPMLTAGDVLESNLHTFDPDKSKTLLSLIHAWAKEDPYKPVHTNPSTMRELVRRIHAPDGSREKLVDNLPIYQAFDQQKLTFTDFKNLIKEFDDARTPEGQKLGQTKDKLIHAMTPQMDHSNPMMGKMDRTGPANVYAYGQMVDRKIEEFRKEGKDVYSLFDPNSNDYLGKPERIKPFQKHMLESIRDFSESLRAAPSKVEPATGGVPSDKQRKPGETPAQYLERMGK
jgi:hypothetical protein